MKKIYCIFIILILFNCANAQDGTNEDSPLQFDNNQAINNISEEQLIFELEENVLSTNDGRTLLLNADQKNSTNQKPSFVKEVIDIPASAEANQKENKRSEVKQKTTGDRTTQAKSSRSPASRTASTSDGKKLAYVKTLYNQSQFFLLAQTVINSNEHEALYYQALGNYNLVRKESRYQGQLNSTLTQEKDSLLTTAKDNLFNIGVNTTDANLKEKAVFWYGLISFTHAKNPKDETELVDTFLYIEDSMKESNIYNDALIYLMMIYKKLGNINKAKAYYKKVLRTSPNDLVYNYRTDRLVSAKEIVRLYSDLK